MSVAEAIARYHDLLTPEVAAASWETLESAMRAERLVFGDRPICSVLRPYFISRGEAEELARAAALVVSALHRLLDRLDPAEYERVLGLSPAEAELARIDAGFAPAEAIARLDAFWPRGGALRFIEYNSESPGGVGFGAALARIFRELPVMRAFETTHAVHAEPVLEHTLDALLASYRAWGGRESKPAIAIVDWREAKTYAEFELCRAAFEAQGHACVIADPDELELTSGRLRARGVVVDVVYRRVVASEVAARLGTSHALVRAARERAACVASGFGAMAMLSKIGFALASDPAASPELTAEERSAIDSYVPWTRVVRDGATTAWTGERVDLLEFVEARREELVVKPATDYGGAGVVLGWTVAPEAWSAALRSALERPSVVQRRVEIPSEEFPVVVDGGVRMARFMADVDPYVFAGSTGKGQGTRLSASELLNVSAGGGSAAPVFVVEAR